jgi:hypothetical protein
MMIRYLGILLTRYVKMIYQLSSKTYKRDFKIQNLQSTSGSRTFKRKLMVTNQMNLFPDLVALRSSSSNNNNNINNNINNKHVKILGRQPQISYMELGNQQKPAVDLVREIDMMPILNFSVTILVIVWN